RPARHTPSPCVRGLQTALVVTGGSEVSIDKHARVKVKFHWDRSETSDLNSSCWIRVGQVWAGKKWGAMFWPRKGHEVIVGFLDGDPDCPIIVGSVYNSVNVPPTDLPGNYVLAGIKSAIFDVDDSTRGNGIFFHDAKDEPYTHVQSDSVDVQKSNLDSFALSPRANVQISGSLPLI
ncbi:MAG: type VI secretion system Vgr family protein, partial [Gemmataceae bacterium]